MASEKALCSKAISSTGHSPSQTGLLLQRGADLKVVSTALGHSSVAITADIYAHVAPVMLQSDANRPDALIESGRQVTGQQGSGEARLFRICPHPRVFHGGPGRIRIS